MPLDENLLDAVADTIAETEREFGAKLDKITERLDETTKVVAEIGKEALQEIARAIAGLKDGEPGRDGAPGEPGEKGDKGDPGEVPELTDELVAAVLDRTRELRLGLDEQMFAATRRFERLSSELEERLAKPGEPGPPGPEGAPGRDGRTGEARGTYDPNETYLKLDRVAFKGSEWIARTDDPGPLPGAGWMIGAQRRDGKPGEPGVGIRRAVSKDYALVLELTDGKAMTIDLRGMFERYDQERGA